MTQVFNITINSVLKEVTECNVSEEVNRFYDVATFNINEEPQQELEVVINYGSKTFTGFVYSTKKIGRDMWSVECRTYGAKLTEPYSPYTEGFDNATTSHDLVDLYEVESGILITITAGNLDFGGSYERKGTMLSALQNVANVTGAEYWDDGSGIQIQPNKAISQTDIDTATEIPPGDIDNFVASKTSIYNKGVGFITIQNGGSETSDIISKNKIYAEIDECSGEIFVYPNPYAAVEHTVGLSPLTAVKIDRSETNSMLDVDVVVMYGAIDSVSSVTLNGVPITDYNFVQNHNVIYFNTLKRGTLTVHYKANAYRGYTNITDVPIGRFITFDIFYLDQLLRFQGLLSPNCLNSNTDGDMVCIVPSDRPYNYGFDVWTIGGDPEFIFYKNTTEIIRNVTSTASDYTSVEKATLEQTVSGYRYKTRYPIITANGARSGDTDISYTTSVDGDNYYFEFTQYYPNVTVSYDTTATKHHVEFAEIFGYDITMVIRNNNTGETCEYELDTKVPCLLDQYVPVDVAGELDMEVSDVKGETLNYVKPDSTAGTVVVDSYGYVKIWVFMDGDYIINTRSLKPRTEITLTSNVLG